MFSETKTVIAGVGGLLLLPSVLTAKAPARDKQQPDIILIMSDDMGFSDIGCYGGWIETPNLDRLAAEGLQYMQFYNSARSCPTRASLLTGLYPHQAGIGHMMNDRGEDGYRGELNRNCMTIAEVMKTAGYGTYMSGKWHVTMKTSPEGPKDNWPCQRGFDRFYGTIHGACSFYDPYTLTRDNQFITPVNDPEYHTDRYYYTDAITDNAISFLDAHKKAKAEDPYFLYLAYTAAHWPMQAFDEDIEHYKGRFDKGWDVLRKEKYERMIKQGIISKKWALTDKQGIRDWDELSEKDKEWELRRMEVYAAMVTRMDMNIGKLIDFLKEKGTLDNTLILFLEDNGGCAEDSWSPNQPRMMGLPDGTSVLPMDDDEYMTTMVPFKTRSGKKVWNGKGVVLGADTTWGAYGKGWANCSNVPFREYKHWVHEGGISTPLIVHWPQGIRKAGEKRQQPGHLIDIMATCVDAAGANYPKEYKGKDIKPMEGVSLCPSFNSNADLKREAIYFEHEGNCAVRMGKWKLVSKSVHGDWRPYPFGNWELYDMENDRTETRNLAAEYPDLVKKMVDMFDAYAHRANVYPLPENRM